MEHSAVSKTPNFAEAKKITKICPEQTKQSNKPKRMTEEKKRRSRTAIVSVKAARNYYIEQKTFGFEN